MTVARQAPLSMGISRQEYWSGMPFPSPGIFLTQGLNLGLLHCRQILYHLSTRETQVERRYQRKVLKEVPQAEGKWYHVEIYLNFCTVILQLPVKSLILAITTLLYKAASVQLFVSPGTWAISFSQPRFRTSSGSGPMCLNHVDMICLSRIILHFTL